MTDPWEIGTALGTIAAAAVTSGALIWSVRSTRRAERKAAQAEARATKAESDRLTRRAGLVRVDKFGYRTSTDQVTRSMLVTVANYSFEPIFGVVVTATVGNYASVGEIVVVPSNESRQADLKDWNNNPDEGVTIGTRYTFPDGIRWERFSDEPPARSDL